MVLGFSENFFSGLNQGTGEADSEPTRLAQPQIKHTRIDVVLKTTTDFQRSSFGTHVFAPPVFQH